MTVKNAFKKLLLFGLIVVTLLSAVSCVLSPRVAYDNFITDMDILYRLEEAAFNVEFGRYSEVWQREIESIITDLETCPVDDAEAVRINNMFIKSANAFLDASQLFLDGSDEARIKGYERKDYAESKYREANEAYQKYINQEE